MKQLLIIAAHVRPTTNATATTPPAIHLVIRRGKAHA